MIDAIAGALKKVFELIGKRVEDKDAKNEIEKELKLAENELELAANEMEKLHHQDVQSARDLGIAETKLSLKDPRAWVRPAWAFSALVMLIITLHGKGWAFEYWDYGIVSAVATYYFGSRAVEKIKEIKKKTAIQDWTR